MAEGKKDGNRELRQKAEHLIVQTNALPEDLAGMSPQQIAGLVHELRVHQVELKMQNDELRGIQAELEKARDRYLHLYDFAPTAYFTVDEKGAVTEANLTAATLLDRPRKALVGRMFSRFIHRDDQDIWYLHRKRLLETGNFQSLQIRLVKSDGGWFLRQS
jgi:PAS domain-containing protein